MSDVSRAGIFAVAMVLGINMIIEAFAPGVQVLESIAGGVFVGIAGAVACVRGSHD